MLVVGLLTALVAGVVAFAIAWAIRHKAEDLGLIQTPNERSSHRIPTPGGGGIGIVVGGLISSVPLALAVPYPTLPITGLSIVVAGIGFIDDRRHIPAPVRLLAQLILAVILVWVLPRETLARELGLPLPVLLASILLVVAAVYWINLFNFMDGIDGLAGAQAMFMLLAAALLMMEGRTDTLLLWWMFGISASVLGFLVLNWPPAKIFMGDAGSTWLGFVIAAIGAYTIALDWLNLWQWLILGALFLADATLTILRRIARGENPLKAHRLHGYQHLSRRWGNHLPVTMLFTAVNVVLLLPLAYAAGLIPRHGPTITAIAYLVILIGLVWAGAGAKERTV
jgi:Fuc2NAc and GlcNAc transferase